MNKIKSKYKNADIFLISAFFLLLFWILCTKLIVKMDDGHFMGILQNENFSLAEWLRLRYETVSGRTIAEAMMMTFLDLPPILWKLFGFVLSEYIIFFVYKISSVFNNEHNIRHVCVLSCSSVFLVFVGVLNAGAFWFAGSFTFLVPCTFMLITITPALFDFLEIKYHFIHKIIAFFCAVVASSQEQAATCTCALLISLLVLCLIKKKLRITSFLPVIPSVAGLFYIITSPGVTNRGLAQAVDSFNAYSDFGVIKKLFLGFSNYCSYTFSLSVVTTILFSLLLFLVVQNYYRDNKRVSAFAVTALTSTVFVIVFLNLIHLLITKKSIDSELKNAFTNNTMNLWVYATVIMCGAVVMMWAIMLLLIVKKNYSLGITVALLCCAALGCGLMMGFSSSIYASGKRVFFYSELFMVIAYIILFSSLKLTKTSKKIYWLALTLSSGFYVFDFINFMFLEIPIMN